MEDERRTSRVSRLALVTTVILLVGVATMVWWGVNERACDRWQHDFNVFASQAQADLDAGTYDRGAYLYRFYRLHDKQPEGCDSPGLTLER